MPLVVFARDGMEVEVPQGLSFIDLSQEVDIDITFGCRSGSCGTCRIEVSRGEENLSPKSELEKTFLEGVMAKENERLACQCTIEGDCTIVYRGTC